MLRSYSNSRKSSPNKTPIKKNPDKCRQLLEAKLKEKREDESPPVPAPPDDNETSV